MRWFPLVMLWMVVLILGLVALIGVPAAQRANIILALAALAASLRWRSGGDGDADGLA
jgi:hypothetical protein